MSIVLILSPYALSRHEHGTGAGPYAIYQAGMHAALENPLLYEIEIGAELDTDVEALFGAAARIAEAMRFYAPAFPLLLAGNCAATLGAVAGLADKSDLGVIWLDGHGDFHTPDTTRTGFLDGMALSNIVGRCWQNMAAQVPGYVQIPESQILHVGARALDSVESAAMFASPMQVLRPESLQIEHAFPVALHRMRQNGVRRVYFHLDLDVLDPQEAPANRFSSPGGLSVTQVERIIQETKAAFPVVGATISAYDPAADPNCDAARAAVRLARELTRR